MATIYCSLPKPHLLAYACIVLLVWSADTMYGLTVVWMAPVRASRSRVGCGF